MENNLNKITNDNNGILTQTGKNNILTSAGKYGNNEDHEPFIDNNLFFPLADMLVDPLHSLGLTPNNVTIISTFFTMLTIYFLEKRNKKLAVASYLFGYILDCVDGKMARKYNEGSNFGMVLDNTSDTLSNFILLVYILYRFDLSQKNFNILIVLIILLFIFSYSYSLNEAILSYNKYGDDNFYKYKEKDLDGKWNNSTEEVLYKYYLSYHKELYNTYRNLFPTYDENNIKKWLHVLKEFGPGTFNIVSAYFIYNL
jgi:hypothetical protein